MINLTKTGNFTITFGKNSFDALWIASSAVTLNDKLFSEEIYTKVNLEHDSDINLEIVNETSSWLFNNKDSQRILYVRIQAPVEDFKIYINNHSISIS